MLEQLRDPQQCRFEIVTLPEELPLAESLELSSSLRSEFGIEPHYLCNKSLPSQGAVALQSSDQPTGQSTGVTAQSSGNSGGFDAYLADWQQRQQHVMAQLRDDCADGEGRVVELPFCFAAELESQLEQLAQQLAASAEPALSQGAPGVEPMIDQLLDDYQVVVCGGTGGVGKTTVSAALGLAAAQRGKRVLVLTIDPARRLASALGLDRLDQPLVEIPTDYSGKLWISMLRAEQIFEHFIEQAEVSDEEKQRLLHNSLFKQLSTTLSGSQEFTSLMWLQQLVASELLRSDHPRYPTVRSCGGTSSMPPSGSRRLFEGSIAKFFAGRIKRFGMFNKLLVGSTQLWLKTLSKMTGAEFIEAVSDFVKGDWGRSPM